jgi:hypothetical protein
MCASQHWKTTGDKSALVARLVSEEKAILSGEGAVTSLIESTIGPKLGSAGAPGELRRFYSSHYQALDRFDRVWYEMKFAEKAYDWESYFCWSILSAGVINARAAYCAAIGSRLPILDFLSALIDSVLETPTP